MNAKKLRTFMFAAILPVQFASAQFVDLKAEVELSDSLSKGMNTWTRTVHCVVGTNCWQIDANFSRNASVTYWFTGTNILEESVITKDVSEELKEFNRPGFPRTSAPAVGTHSTRVTKSSDGNPGRTVRQLDQMTMPARVSWLAFCSGPCLKREGREIFPPSDLWKELVRTDRFEDRTATFQDPLGLPERMDLFTTNGLTVMQYRVTSSTNFLGWHLPLTFELVQYCPAPIPGNPHVTAGTNGWQLEFIARGKVALLSRGAAP
jgi:hypothetical protein